MGPNRKRRASWQESSRCAADQGRFQANSNVLNVAAGSCSKLSYCMTLTLCYCQNNAF